jgi:hypothetical protein
MRILLTILAVALQGCAYTAVSTITTVTTGKSIGDHVMSTTGNDCNGIRYAVGKQDYYCERPREAGTTYNKHEF